MSHHNQRLRFLLFFVLLFLWIVIPLLAQTPTPLASPTPQPQWWQITQSNVPYWIILLVGLLIFVLGGVARPLVEHVGNVVLNWIKGLGKQGDFRRRYLTAVVTDCRHVPLLPANVIAAKWSFRRKSAELEDLYTRLALRSVEQNQDTPEGRQTELIRDLKWYGLSRHPKNWLQKQWWRIRPPFEASDGDLGHTIMDNPRLVVRGDPGSGKTTLLHYLALTCARSLRNEKRDGDNRHLARRRFGWKRTPFPILVPFNLLADVSNWPEGRTLLDEIVDTLPGELRKRYPTGFFERQLRQGHCLILLDGFDELGSREARGRMARLVADMADMFNQKTNRIVVSTRIVGYEGQLNAFRFVIRNVQELDDRSIRQLVGLRYKTTAVSEGMGLSKQEQEDLKKKYQTQADQLLADLQRNKSLRALTTNPLLLALIVLVHMVKISLPEERHILYRDCVEILTERWRESQRANAGIQRQRRPDELTIDHKIAILREIALSMQQRQVGNGSQVVISRHDVEAMIARRLPDFLAAHLPKEEEPRRQECIRRAELLLDNIRLDSGILTEKGLDSTGKPVVGFSHLTFQEYLAADALRDQPDQLPLLKSNLFAPAWREVVLLYVAMGDADTVVQACLADSRALDLSRLLLAGRCLAEKIAIEPSLRSRVIEDLTGYLQAATSDGELGMDRIMVQVGGEASYDWLLDTLPDLLSEEERQALADAGGAGVESARFTTLQQILLRLALSHGDVNIRQTAGTILSALGDPRNLDEMVPIPAGEFEMGGELYDSEKPRHKLTLPDFRISKYPVTNAQYARFVAATDHPVPVHWWGNTPSPERLTRPVLNVSWHDAQAYCAWLSQEQGELVRLPTEAEWEKAARGTDGREYPWGNDFNPQLCNMGDTGIGDISPVGIFPQGASPYGCLDMSGNVWEWTSSLWGKISMQPEFKYPYQADDGRENMDEPDVRVLRGGSFAFNAVDVRCSARVGGNPVGRVMIDGFRVVSPGF